ncbi:MAG: hypothetical protein ABFD54_01455 [Armatimonadota bacterium]|nr:hypothetical protein [bacterium]
MKRCFLVCVVLIALVFASSAYAAEIKATNSTAAFKTKTKSVAIFKDGYGFFLREGQAPLNNGWCMTDYIPQATTGTFWLYTLEPGTLVNTVRSTSKNEIKFKDTDELIKCLDRYKGLLIKLTTADASLEGELLRIVDNMVLVKDGKQVSVILAADIKTAKILGQPLLIQVDSAKPVNNVTMQMGYLQQGISWIPTYTLDLVSPNQAKIDLRATITNSIEDIQDCSIYFVVGVPNFSMKGQLDPLTVNALGTAVLTSLASQTAGLSQLLNNAMIADMSHNSREEEHDQSVPVVNATLEGLQDMYFYEKKGLDVLLGDVVMTSVMSSMLPYRSVFVWDVGAGNKVNHDIILKNTTDLPLTTGLVMVVQNGKPVSQDIMKYISPKAEGRLRLTQTTDIQTDVSEKEIQRKPVEKINNYSYIPILMGGSLMIDNHRKETAEVEISWSTNGRVTEVSDNAEIKSQTVIAEGLNPQNNLTCTVKVEPSKRHIVSYQYIRYVEAQAR